MVGLLPWLQRSMTNGGNSYFASSSVSPYYFFLFLTSATYYRGKQGLSKRVSDPSTEIISCAPLPLEKRSHAETKGSVSKLEIACRNCSYKICDRQKSKVASNLNDYIYLNVIRNAGIFNNFFSSNI